jgi:ABC-type polysaccharide/polyol phosphate export permease
MTYRSAAHSTPRHWLLGALSELRFYRGTIAAFAERNIRVRYKQAVLGVAWAALQPIALMVVFTVALGRLAGLDGGGTTYAAFSLSALVGWSLVQAAVQSGSDALVVDGALLRKVYFPREVPVLAGVLAAGVEFTIGLCVFFLVGPFLGARVAVTWLLAPLMGLGLMAVSTAVSLLLAGLNVYYRDFRHAMPFLLQLWLFLSPVTYPITVIPENWRLWYAFVNPAAGMLDGLRRSLALGVLPDASLVTASAAGTVLLAGASYRVFKLLEPHFADVV